MPVHAPDNIRRANSVVFADPEMTKKLMTER
jgi:hypothetical protein